MGLVSMRERAELIGGELHVGRPPQGGTLVQLQVAACLADSLSPDINSQAHNTEAPAHNEVA